MSSKIIKSFSINYFTNNQSSFFIADIDNFDNNYPVLSSEFRSNIYMLLIANKKDYSVTINACEFIDNERCIYVIKKNDIVKMSFGSNFKGTLVAFEDCFFSKRYHDNVLNYFDFLQLNASSLQVLDSSSREKIDLLLDFMKAEYQSTRQTKHKVLRSYLNILLCELQYNESITNLFCEKGKGISNERVLAFLDLVEVYFKEAKTPSFYAEKLCVTPNYLNKLCKQDRGVTAGQIVRQRIIVEAKRLLQFTTYNINEIASELCFESTSYFVTFFKKQEGITPENYRKSFT
ncbi:helix-turn-helix domain-containing protein [Myroides injenensis]|uniref:helix-turn-helix domain-containing protein n=1 Tax=Myroides injenensis TaxID=1183151 RepID=UPI000289A2CF|nr:helix-turn-helix domain-containing protein [Myroides injenensis]